jgi:hypothetical protein
MFCVRNWHQEKTVVVECEIKCGCRSLLCGAGFSLWVFVVSGTKPHRLKPAPQNPAQIFDSDDWGKNYVLEEKRFRSTLLF